jgi:hypothetical protein
MNLEEREEDILRILDEGPNQIEVKMGRGYIVGVLESKIRGIVEDGVEFALLSLTLKGIISKGYDSDNKENFYRRNNSGEFGKV